MLKLSLTFAILLGLFTHCHRPTDEKALTILFTGDVLLDRGVRHRIDHHGVEPLFREVTPLFRQADAVVANLECPLTTHVAPLHKRFIFRGEPQWAEGLHRAGITHAAMANNHTNDQGRQGLSDTYHTLLSTGITPLGYGITREQQLTPALITKGKVRVALFNAVLFPLENWQYLEGMPDICQPSVKRLCDHIRRYKQQHPDTYIVTVVHWGTEFQPHPNLQQRYDARQLVSAGTDLLIGHHPHVVQDEEHLGEATVFYSLGNFVFDQSHPDACHSLLVEARFTPTGVHTRTLPVEIRQCRPLMPED